MATIQELLALREELASKQAKVKELEDTMAELQEELARLKGEAPPEIPAAIPEKPFYKRWTFWLPVGGITTLITGIAICKRKK